MSIVRFRAAIKEPEELAYLFFTISIGLGLGANQREVVLIAFGILMIIIWGKHFLSKKEEYQNLFLTVTSVNNKASFGQINDLVKKNFPKYELKRLDEDDKILEAAFYLDIKKKENLITFKEELQKIDPTIRIAFIDNKA